MLMAAQHNGHRGWQSAPLSPPPQYFDTIDVWLVGLAHPHLMQPDQLSDHERARADQFIHPKRKAGYITSHVALRNLLSAYARIPIKEVKVGQKRNGKPVLEGQSDLHFNLSHSDHFALIALSNVGPVGIDLEDATKPAPYEIANIAFSPRENQHLQNSAKEDKSTLFYDTWCRKESVIKADGRGLNINLSEVEVMDLRDCHISQTWSFYPLPDIKGHSASLAAAMPNLEIRPFKFCPQAHINQ